MGPDEGQDPRRISPRVLTQRPAERLADEELAAVRRVVEVGDQHPLQQVGVGLLAVTQLRQHRRTPDPQAVGIHRPPLDDRRGGRAVVEEDLPDGVRPRSRRRRPTTRRCARAARAAAAGRGRATPGRPRCRTQGDRGVPLLAVLGVLPQLEHRRLPLGPVDEAVLDQQGPQQRLERRGAEADVGQLGLHVGLLLGGPDRVPRLGQGRPHRPHVGHGPIVAATSDKRSDSVRDAPRRRG